MEALQHLATWVKEQHAQEYILTWLLTQPGIWWSNGEVYQAALEESGTRLKEYVQKQQQDELFKGIADKLQPEQWDKIAGSLNRILTVYQTELLKLQAEQQNQLKKTVARQASAIDRNPALSLQQALPDPGDALTGNDSLGVIGSSDSNEGYLSVQPVARSLRKTGVN